MTQFNLSSSYSPDVVDTYLSEIDQTSIDLLMGIDLE